MPAVETRKGILQTALKRHLWCSLISFVLVLFAFKWLFVMNWGINLIFGVSTFVYMGYGCYSYSYSQAKIDKRDKDKYDWLMPLKIGIIWGLVIFLPAFIHIVILAIMPPAGELLGLVVRFYEYPFFYWFYGSDGWYFNYPAMVLISLLPIAVAYVSYALGIKRFVFTEKLNRIFYKKK